MVLKFHMVLYSIIKHKKKTPGAANTKDLDCNHNLRLKWLLIEFKILYHFNPYNSRGEIN